MQHSREDRVSRLISVTVRCRGRSPFPAVLRNVSSYGLALGIGQRIGKDRELEVELPGAGWVKGLVRWEKDGRVGIRLYDPIDPAQVKASVGGTPETRSGKLPW